MPPNQVWMPYQPQATRARSSAGSLAPWVPNEARASTAKGMPYLAPACPMSSMGISTMRLPRNTVITACDHDMPFVIMLAAKVYAGMHITMPIHRAAKWYQVQVRWLGSVGARSWFHRLPVDSPECGACDIAKLRLEERNHQSIADPGSDLFHQAHFVPGRPGCGPCADLPQCPL